MSLTDSKIVFRIDPSTEGGLTILTNAKKLVLYVLS